MAETARLLDEKTLEALAKLICGGVPCGNSFLPTRRDEDIAGFFRRAGVECPEPWGLHPESIPWGLSAPEFHSLRKQWTSERLMKYNSAPSEIGKVITRLADPREYSGKPELHRAVVAKLNRILLPEGLEIYFEGVKPKIREIPPALPTFAPVSSEQTAVPHFKQLTEDEKLGAILENRWKEAIICMNKGAPLAAIILMGSVLEGALFAFLHKYPQQANQAKAAPKDESGKVKKFNEWSLSNLIDVACECGWIQRDAKDFAHTLREYRNLIHPREQLVRGEQPDVDTCRICLEVARAAVNDLVDFVKSPKHGTSRT